MLPGTVPASQSKGSRGGSLVMSVSGVRLSGPLLVGMDSPGAVWRRPARRRCITARYSSSSVPPGRCGAFDTSAYPPGDDGTAHETSDFDAHERDQNSGIQHASERRKTRGLERRRYKGVPEQVSSTSWA